MNIYTLLMIIPVVLAVALIIMIVRRNITENSGRSIDIAPAIPAVVVLMIAILVIAPMAENVAPYVYDEGSGELTIKTNIGPGGPYEWDSYADDVRSLVIEEGVQSVAAGALDSLTSLEFISIPESLTSIGAGAFGVTMQTVFGTATTAAGEYAGTGDGTVYLCDPTIFTYSNDRITGLTDSGRTAVALVLPNEYAGTAIRGISNGTSDAPTLGGGAYTKVAALPGSSIGSFGIYAFYHVTSLTDVSLPASLQTIGHDAFNGCTGLKSVSLPEGTLQTQYSAFDNCSSIESVSLPSSMTYVGPNTFRGCTGIAAVSFASGFGTAADFSLGNNCFINWTFYASDGTTLLDKTVASNLAGKAFMGTAAALVEVSAGTLSLTPDQIQQVNLHSQELQTQELDIQPLPFQPSLQTEQEQETA